MSVAAVMLVKDEADIIGFTLEHLAGQVDHVFLADNLSTDGTGEIASSYEHVTVIPDKEPAYWQSAKTTRLARRARLEGFDWVVPVDADEFWYSTDRRPIRELLDGMAGDVLISHAPLYNHRPSSFDVATSILPNPFARIGWRQIEKGQLGKVACRLLPGLVIEAGNHGARIQSWHMVGSGGLTVRHFPWRSEEQYLRKIRNGEAAYALTSLPSNIGEHWRMWAGLSDEAVLEHYRRWFHLPDPQADDTMIYDPAPL